MKDGGREREQRERGKERDRKRRERDLLSLVDFLNDHKGKVWARPTSGAWDAIQFSHTDVWPQERGSSPVVFPAADSWVGKVAAGT